MRCNNCGGRVCVPAQALVPALACEGCGRLVPVTGVKHKAAGRTGLNRALRATRRRRIAEERVRAAE